MLRVVDVEVRSSDSVDVGPENDCEKEDGPVAVQFHAVMSLEESEPIVPSVVIDPVNV